MKIALVTSEAVPFAKTGGLADVCGALPLALEDLGHEVVMIMPKYQAVRSSGTVFKSLDRDFDWTAMGEASKAYFLKNDMYLREGLYGDTLGDYPDNLKRFSYLSMKALELFKKIDFNPDIIHCHDWQASLVPVFAKAYPNKFFFKGEKKTKILLTIHNISYQGIFSKEQMPDTGLGWEYFSVSALEFFDRINVLKGGILYADLINTVSVTHSREVQTKEFGCGLEGVLSDKKDRFFGIINGVDYKVWNPQGDPNIFKNYSVDTVEDKKLNKVCLQGICGLAKDDKLPLLGFVGRLVEQKGIDLILRSLPHLCRRGMQVVLLGSGEPKYERELTELAKQFPKLVSVSLRFDDQLAHRIYAASDVFLMPSRFEPCGIGQLISFKYGTVPVVYKTGGLADTVIDYSLKRTDGTGFVFTDYNETEFLLSIQRAIELFADKERWHDLMKRLMHLNFSWKESAKEYVSLYEKAKTLP